MAGLPGSGEVATGLLVPARWGDVRPNGGVHGESVCAWGSTVARGDRR